VSSSIGNKCAEAQSAANLLLVVNSTSAASGTVARYYAEHRGVPQDNVCSITTAAAESISREAYAREIEQPIWKCITTLRAHDRILYIVLTKDVPIRISGTGGRTGTNASVDSELTLLYRRRTGQASPIAGFVPNPYFAGTAPIASIKPFTHESQDIYLVTRLDGYTVEEKLAIARGFLWPRQVERNGLRPDEVVIDFEHKSFQRPGGTFALWSESCFFEAITGLQEKGFVSPEKAAELLADNRIYTYRQQCQKEQKSTRSTKP
jgi:uncharacterized protein (TIGR03790 family)